MPSAKKKTKTKKTTTNKGVKKSTKKVTTKSPAKKITKTNIKETVAKTILPKKAAKKVDPKTTETTKEPKTPKTTKVTTKAKTTAPKKAAMVKKNEVPILENTVELPKTKEQVRVEEETRQLNLKKELERKLALEEDLEKTHELNLKKTTKSKKKSHAKNIARSKTNEFIKKLKKLQRKIKIYGLDSVVPKKYLATGIVTILIVIICIMSINMIKPEIQSINLENVAKEIDQLKTLSFEISNTSNVIADSKAYKNSLKEYYEYDFSMFNLQRSWLDEFKIFYNEKTKQLFMAFKPSNDNTANVTSAIEKFLKSNKISYTKEEYDGYIFYINSNDNKKVVSKIKQSQIKVFDILQELNKEEIKTKYGIDSSLYKEYKVKTAMIVKSDVTEYLLFYPKNHSAAKEIEELMEKYYQEKEEKWANNEENYNLIKNRYTGNYNGYLVYIVSKDNDLVLQLLKK